MKNLNDIVAVYQEELRKGDILIAYNELVKFVMNTRMELVKKLGKTLADRSKSVQEEVYAASFMDDSGVNCRGSPAIAALVRAIA